MRLTDEYHMTCPCGRALVLLKIGALVCPDCGRKGEASFEAMMMEAKKR